MVSRYFSTAFPYLPQRSSSDGSIMNRVETSPGGLGSLPGTIVAAVSLGLVENLSTIFIGAS